MAEWLRNGLQNRIGASIIGGHQFQASRPIVDAALNGVSDDAGVRYQLKRTTDPYSANFSEFIHFLSLLTKATDHFSLSARCCAESQHRLAQSATQHRWEERGPKARNYHF